MSNSNPRTAPDGGPLSNILMPQQRFNLIEVCLIENPSCVLKIAQADFNPAMHRRVAGGKSLVQAPRVLPNHTEEPAAELLTWTMKRLKEMPEFQAIETPAGTKAELVQQILEVRGVKIP